jgi:predicted metalloprotease
MRWSPGPRSRNLEDRRGSRIVSRGLPLGIGGVLVLFVLSLITGQDLLSPLMQQGALEQAEVRDGPLETTPEEEARVDFVSFVLDDVQATWPKLLGNRYREAQLVLFRGATESACGLGQSAMGPFYCPADSKVYLDLEFFDQLAQRFGAPGEFAQAYVIAHEFGHHVQNLLGIERQVRQLQQARPGQANALSVRMELQADCLAGLWGGTTARRNLLEPGDVEDGLRAAAAIGDDAIQTQAQGRVRPETFTHGSAAQRVEWLRRGLQAGSVEECDTFSAP